MAAVLSRSVLAVAVVKIVVKLAVGHDSKLIQKHVARHDGWCMRCV